MAKISDLLDDALQCPDYDKRINFLLAGLLSADANDTPEKEAENMEYLKEIYDFCCNYSGEKINFIKRTAETIKQYID